jgi:citrate synthase
MSDDADRPVWRTAIAEATPDSVMVRGYDLGQLITGATMTDMFYLVMRGEMPTPEQRRVLDSLLVAVCDHGIATSTVVARYLAASGVPIQACVAGGVMTFGDIHGGAGEALAKALSEAVVAAGEEPDVEALAASVVRRSREDRIRISGFGHPQHPAGDPRVPRVLAVADAEGISGVYVRLVRAIEREITNVTGRRIPMNIDGCMAAVALDLGFTWRAVRAFIFVPRTIGLAAHVIEEVEREPGWRHVPLSDITYDGAPQRDLEAASAPIA